MSKKKRDKVIKPETGSNMPDISFNKKSKNREIKRNIIALDNIDILLFPINRSITRDKLQAVAKAMAL